MPSAFSSAAIKRSLPCGPHKTAFIPALCQPYQRTVLLGVHVVSAQLACVRLTATNRWCACQPPQERSQKQQGAQASAAAAQQEGAALSMSGSPDVEPRMLEPDFERLWERPQQEEPAVQEAAAHPEEAAAAGLDRLQEVKEKAQFQAAAQGARNSAADDRELGPECTPSTSTSRAPPAARRRRVRMASSELDEEAAASGRFTEAEGAAAAQQRPQRAEAQRDVEVRHRRISATARRPFSLLMRRCLLLRRCCCTFCLVNCCFFAF